MTASPLGTSPAVLSPLDPDPALHLLRRATFGPTAQMAADILRRGTSVWLDDQLQPTRIADGAVNTFLTRYSTLTFSAAKLASLTVASERQLAFTETVEATLVRQIWSNRQLVEVMVDFWSNHLNVFGALAPAWTAKSLEDRVVIRKHALASFESLLLADARSAAMLMYLGNDKSRLDRPNENYGRELLELHTVGIDAGFTEADVLNSAYVLTGRTCDEKRQYYYRPDWHYVGPVKVLGWSSANSTATGGLAVGDSYLRYLARHPSTALALSRKLAIRFVSDDPPDSLVNALAEVYLANGTAIVPWLRALFGSAEFADSIGRKARRPLEDVVASIRAMGIGLPVGSNKTAISEIRAISVWLDNQPFSYRAPTGYPDIASRWHSVTGTVSRWNVHRTLVTGAPEGLTYPALDQLLAGPPMATHGQMVDRLTVALTRQIFRSDHRQALLTAAGMTDGEPFNKRKVDQTLPNLTVLALDSPYLLLR